MALQENHGQVILVLGTLDKKIMLHHRWSAYEESDYQIFDPGSS